MHSHNPMDGQCFPGWRAFFIRVMLGIVAISVVPYIPSRIVSAEANEPTYVTFDFHDQSAGFRDNFEGDGYRFAYNTEAGFYAAENKGNGGFYHASRPDELGDVDVKATVRIDPETTNPGARAMLGVRYVQGAGGLNVSVNPTSGTAALNELIFTNGQFSGFTPLSGLVSVGVNAEYTLRIIARGDRVAAIVNDIPVGTVQTGITAPGVISLGVAGSAPNRARMLFSNLQIGQPVEGELPTPGTTSSRFTTDFHDQSAGFRDHLEGDGYRFVYNLEAGYYMAENSRARGSFYHATHPVDFGDVDAQATFHIDAETPNPNARATLGIRYVQGVGGINVSVNPISGTAVLNEMVFGDGQYTGLRAISAAMKVKVAPEYTLRIVARGDQVTAVVNGTQIAQVQTSFTSAGKISLGVQTTGSDVGRMLFTRFEVGIPTPE